MPEQTSIPLQNAPGNILIVDDTPANLRLLNQLLSSHGHKVRAVTGGLQTLKAIEKEIPELILLDIRMPDMDGFEVCRRIKENSNWNKIPIIFISAASEAKDRVTAFQVGGADYVSKPFQTEELYARVSHQLNIGRLTSALESKIEHEVKERKHKETLLTESENFSRKIIESAQEAIITIDNKSYIRNFNPSACKLFGYTLNEILGKSVTLLMPKKYQQLHLHGLNNYLSTGKKYLLDNGPRELTGVRKDGSQFPLEINISELVLEEQMFVAMLYDISDRVAVQNESKRINDELEKRVQERTLQLEESNKEMETFCHSVSHDLRAPLRSINGFSEILIEDYHDKLDEEGCNHLQRVKSAASNMDDLINGMLLLSHLGRQKMSNTRINLSALAEQVANDLQETEPEHKVEFKIKPDMTVHADFQLLNIMLTNLIGNAWKYSHHEAQPRIEIGQTEHQGKEAYFIRDNGVGFNMEHADKLFVIFRRLHSDKKFIGTGVGLATVSRILKRHNGTIWAESYINEGATFYFTLPDNADER